MFRNLFRKKSIEGILSEIKNGYGDGERPETAGAELRKVLGVRDLTFMGIAAVVGAGIFSTIGEAAFHGGPGVALLFIITAVTCGFSALCYAEFASRIPVSGSAYTYAYASFGELVAWIIGWDLLMEYAIGNIAVAISWSEYFTNLLEGFNIHIPHYLTMDYLSASRGYEKVQELTQLGKLAEITDVLKHQAAAWMEAPSIGGIRLIADVPALAIVIAITILVYVGIKETKRVTNGMVYLKIAVVIGVILVGAFFVAPDNWTPFLPNGFKGVLRGVSGVFFAFIGFDAISTTAEECKNPQRDLPRGMIYSLIVCTVLYVLVALVLTGMVNYKELAVGDPLAFVFHKIGMNNISYVISVSAVIATASVLLVFQMGQPRIWMSMSRDGLLPKRFAAIHPRYQTPSFSTIVTGLVVAIPALFMNLTEVTDLTSIGTLFAFVLVCGGVLLLEQDPSLPKGKFKIPYINSKYIIPGLLIAAVIYFWEPLCGLFSYSGDWHTYKDNLPYFLFIALALVIAVLSFLKNLSLIPVLGLLSCFYLMTELGYTNWLRFLIWLGIGLVIYFTYGYRNSKLNSSKTTKI